MSETEEKNAYDLEEEEERRIKEKKEKHDLQERLVADILLLISDPETADVTFLVGNKEKGDELKPVKGHKVLLSARCPVLRAMFFMGFKESSLKEIVIPNIEVDIFKLFIDYLYSGSVTITKDNVMKLLPVADQFNVSSLRKACFEYLVRNINKDSVIKMLLESQDGTYKFNCDELISRCLKFIDKHTSDVIKSNDFFLFEERTVKEMVQSNKLNVEEIDLFKAIIRWGNYRRRDINCTTPLKEILKDLVPHIRYPLISGPDLVNIVRPCQVAPEDLYVAALEYVNAPDLFENPTGTQYKPREEEENEEETDEEGGGSKFHWVFDRTQHLNKFKYSDTKSKGSFTKIGSSDWNDCFVFGSKAFKTGIVYWEIKIDTTSSGSGLYFGITDDKNASYYSRDICAGCQGGKYNLVGSDLYVNQGESIGIKLDFKKLQVSYYKNGTSAGITGTLKKGQAYTPVVHSYYTNDKCTLVFPKKIPK